MRYNLIKEPEQERGLLEQILHNRGLTQEEMQRYITPNVSECFTPGSFENIFDAASLLIKTLVHQEKIHIQVDSDCDGYTSSAVLLNYLHRVFPASVENLISYNLHSDKHHGINVKAIPEDVKLIIVPDASSNENQIHKELAEKGIDIIVLDHHDAEPDIFDPAVIVNNQMCSYPNKALSGVGVVYKFCLILDRLLKKSYANDYLDLVALGMVADMMDLRSLETRYLTWVGMQQPRNPFIVGMMEKNEFKIQGQLTPFTVSWYIAPFVNAMCRSGNPSEKNILFRSMLEYEAGKLVPSTKRGGKGQEETILTQALRTAGNVKNHQDKEKQTALETIRKQIKEEGLDQNSIIIVKVDGEMESNLNGLVANQIMSEYQKPTLILTKRVKEIAPESFAQGIFGQPITFIPKTEITWEGSARGYITAGIDDWRKFIENTGLCLYAEGHPMAFGVGFTPDGLELFKAYIRKQFPTAPEVMYNVDFIWDYKEPNLGSHILEIAKHKDLWGQGVKEPLVVIKGVPVTSKEFLLMGKGTLKILIPKTKISCIKFGYGEELYEQTNQYFQSADTVIKMDIIGRCAENNFNGIAPQIEIEDFQISSTHSWYF